MLQSKIADIYGDKQYDIRLAGFWQGEVTDNKDPDNEGKIKVRIPELFGEESIECQCMQDHYSHHIPKKGMYVMVAFMGLSKETPYYFSSWYPTKKKMPDMTGKPDQEIYQVINESREALLTIVHDEGQKFEIRLNKAGSYIQYDAVTNEINIFSDSKPEGADKKPVNINGKFPATGLPCARMFDKVFVPGNLTGIPSTGVIIEGSKRVIICNDKKGDLPI